MASIEENLRATLLSLKQISDRVKSLILTVVTKSELNSAKQEVLDAIDSIPEPDLSAIAKEATSQEILTAVENIDIDTSDLAKQGSNPNVTLTDVDEKIDDFYDTFDADMALQLQGIIGEGDSVEGNSQTEGEIERLRTLQESYDALSANNNSVVEFFGITPLQGYEFMTDTEVTDEIEDIMQVIDNELTSEQAAAITTEAMEIINTQNL